MLFGRIEKEKKEKNKIIIFNLVIWVDVRKKLKISPQTKKCWYDLIFLDTNFYCNLGVEIGILLNDTNKFSEIKHKFAELCYYKAFGFI